MTGRFLLGLLIGAFAGPLVAYGLILWWIFCWECIICPLVEKLCDLFGWN